MVLLHLLSPDEADPVVGGDVKLVDVETGAAAELTLDAATVGHYRRRLAEWQSGIAATAGRYDMHYVPVVTDLEWDRLVLQTLRLRGVIK